MDYGSDHVKSNNCYKLISTRWLFDSASYKAGSWQERGYHWFKLGSYNTSRILVKSLLWKKALSESQRLNYFNMTSIAAPVEFHEPI